MPKSKIRRLPPAINARRPCIFILPTPTMPLNAYLRPRMRLAPALLELLDEGSPERRRMLAGFERIRGLLGKGGAADRVAEMAVALLARRTAR